MATTRLDKWLKGVDEFVDLDTDEAEQLLADLRAQVETTQIKIDVLDQLLRRRRPRAARAPATRSASETEGREAAIARPSNWKGMAVIRLMEAQPDRVWSAADMRNALRDSGEMTGDEGTPTKLLLDRLAARGQVAAVAPDQFTMRTAGGQQQMT